MALTPQQLKSSLARKAQVVEFCESLPEARTEPLGERHLVFKVRKKSFAYYMNDHHGDGRIALACKSTHAEQQRRIQADPTAYFSPPYLGKDGWIGYRIDGPRFDMGAVMELIQAAYLAVAPKKLAERI